MACKVVAIRHQAITGTKNDLLSEVFRETNLGAISQVLMNLIHEMNL